MNGLDLIGGQASLDLHRYVGARLGDGGGYELNLLRGGQILEAFAQDLSQSLLEVGDVLALEAPWASAEVSWLASTVPATAPADAFRNVLLSTTFTSNFRTDLLQFAQKLCTGAATK